jgi:hypothetical protein
MVSSQSSDEKNSVITIVDVIFWQTTKGNELFVEPSALF